MDLDTHLDSYDKRSRPSVISLQSLQAQRVGVSKKPTLTSSPEADESPSSPWFGRSESIPYADEWTRDSLIFVSFFTSRLVRVTKEILDRLTVIPTPFPCFLFWRVPKGKTTLEKDRVEHTDNTHWLQAWLVCRTSVSRQCNMAFVEITECFFGARSSFSGTLKIYLWTDWWPAQWSNFYPFHHMYRLIGSSADSCCSM